MRALAVVRQELASALPLLGPDDAAQSAVRTLRDELGEFDQLADEIDEAIDEDALMRREEQAEREAVLAAELGERAASRARLEREATEEGGGGGAEGEGLWGEGQAWVIRPE